MIRFNGGCGARRILGVALSRDKILHTAYEVLATYGLADLSMRRLASELQVAPGRSAFLSSQWKDVGRSWRSQADGLDM